MKKSIKKVNDEYLNNASQTLETYILKTPLDESVFYILFAKGQYTLFRSVLSFSDYWYKDIETARVSLSEQAYNNDKILIKILTENI